MATIAVTTVTVSGAAEALVAASGGGDSLPNNGNTELIVKNGGGSPVTVTVVSSKKCDQGFSHDVIVSVAAGAQEHIGPFPVARFGRTCAVTYSGVTSVTVGAVSH